MTDLSIIRADRHTGIGSSDAKRIIEGDWLGLYNEKLGITEQEDLSHVFRVQLGVYTEQFHLEWIAKRDGFPLELPNERKHHPDYDFMFCHLDGWRPDQDTFIEVKHSNSRATVRDKAVYYMAQLQHAIAITGVEHAYFSVIAGNDEPEMAMIKRNNEYIERMIGLEASFWWHVSNQVPPEITPKGDQARLVEIGKQTPIDGLRAYNMETSNAWAEQAAEYTGTVEAAARYEVAKKELKSLMPEDASEATGHGITIKRDKRGALRFYT